MFELFEHKADIGIRGIGKSLEEAFCEIAKAMFSVMTNINSVQPIEKIEFEVEADDKENLLFNFLNELVFLRDDKQMFFSKFECKISKIESGKGFELNAKAFGEKINPQKHEIKSEVKAATYALMKIEEKNENFLCQCIVDV